MKFEFLIAMGQWKVGDIDGLKHEQGKNSEVASRGRRVSEYAQKGICQVANCLTRVQPNRPGTVEERTAEIGPATKII